MRIGERKRLFIPGRASGNGTIVLYDVGAMLDLQFSEKPLTGYPSQDLPPEAWGTVNFPVRKMLRWVRNHNRLIKVELNTGDTKRITYSEPKEWQRYITPEQWQWLMQISEVFRLQVEEEIERRKTAKVKAQPEPEPKVKRQKKPKVKAKIRRKMSKRELVMEGE